MRISTITINGYDYGIEKDWNGNGWVVTIRSGFQGMLPIKRFLEYSGAQEYMSSPNFINEYVKRCEYLIKEFKNEN